MTVASNAGQSGAGPQSCFHTPDSGPIVSSSSSLPVIVTLEEGIRHPVQR